MCKVFEKTDELNDFVVLYDLQASEANFPFLVDWNYHAPSGDREACSRPTKNLISIRWQNVGQELVNPSKSTEKPVVKAWY